MDMSPYEALAEAAADVVDFDGLVVTRADDRLSVATPETELTVPIETPRTALADVSEYVTNWYFWHQRAPQSESRWAFLRWLEQADDRPVPERYDTLSDGVSRMWGQLSITTRVTADGTRLYDLRHEADTDVTTEALDTYEQPSAIRDLVEFDADGRYRPLKTAPTLQCGWVFPALDGEALVRAVDYCYPATVENWHREREDALDVTHWRETMARQTGIYGVVETWDRGEGHEHVEWVAEACCADSECLKRREWEYDEMTDLGVDGGDGVFPCREPCSMVISAARRWTRLEGEQPRTYEFELTPSEKAQVEAIVEAVAEDRVGDIREADFRDDANRWRARFLRAKRVDEDGTLGGVAPEQEDSG